MTPLISWGSAFDTGFGAIDEEHRALADALNHLHEAQHAGADRKTVAGLLGNIAQHISVHFSHEEQMMAQLHYPHREEHWREHIELLADIADVMEEYEEGAYDDSPDALDHYLKFWLLTHILTEDVKLASFLINCQRDGVAF